MALSNEVNIKTPRDLCKVVTGRTGVGPIERCNRYLARYRPEDGYVMAFTFKGSLTKTPRTLSISVKSRDEGRTGNYGTVTLEFPFSKQELVSAVVTMDGTAEIGSGLTYGARR